MPQEGPCVQYGERLRKARVGWRFLGADQLISIQPMKTRAPKAPYVSKQRVDL